MFQTVDSDFVGDFILNVTINRLRMFENEADLVFVLSKPSLPTEKNCY